MLDFIGIGIGPFNLSLAALLKDTSDLRYRFFEQKQEFAWHEGMLLPDTTLQVPFMADLVSMVEPTSPFSFLNYLKQHDRLYQFYFLEDLHIPRQEYNHYCQWASRQMPALSFASSVTAVRAISDGFEVDVNERGSRQRYACRNLVVGTGTVPVLPACLKTLATARPEQCFHSAQFKQRMLSHHCGDVVVLGSGQSAAETFIHLFDQQLDANNRPRFQLNWLSRSPGFFPMEYSPLGLEHFSPDYTRYFFNLKPEKKDQLLAKQGLLYKGIDFQTIGAIYQRLYHRTVGGRASNVILSASSELVAARPVGGRIDLQFRHVEEDRSFQVVTDHVIAATGYRPELPACLLELAPLLERDRSNRLVIDEQYRVSHAGQGTIYAQNAELHTHGVGAPDLGLGAYRAAHIANQLLGTERFRLGGPHGFQRFGSPTTKPAETNAAAPASMKRA